MTEIEDRREADGGAPEWTGERCLPWIDDVQVVYEHLHRYHFAARLAAGRRVLDVGCGEGYGAALLARDAQQVTAVDIDEDCLRHAAATYQAENLHFERRSALELKEYDAGSFDVVVCFEVIEHVAEQEALADGMAHVLADGGILVLSTPNRPVYSERDGFVNEFHVRELDRGELEALLAPRFGTFALWGQVPTAGSHLELLRGRRGGTARVVVQRNGRGWREVDLEPRYFVAVATNGDLPALPKIYALLDPRLEVVHGALRMRDRLAEEVERARSERERLVQQVDEGRNELEQAQGELGRLRRELDEATSELARARSELDERTRHAEAQVRREQRARVQLRRLESALDAERERWRGELERSEAAREELERYVAMIHGTRGWRALVAYRDVVNRTRRARAAARSGELGLPVPSAIRRLPARSDDDDGDGALRRYAGAAGTDIVFRRPADPAVSVVIPAFNNVGVTLACLASLADNTRHDLIEVIVVDDVSTDSTPEALAQTSGVTVIRNEQNLGFTQTCNRGAAAAQGEFVLFLNNDVEVQPGWLEPLLEAAASAPDVGAVGSKLVYPDGTLQEAGAIIWSDGSAWNFGRGGDAEAPEFNYRREVDYCSAASLLVRRDVLDGIGGFDVRYAPIYCEDSDLCFAVRAEGFRVLYEPRSVVVHNEGTTHGTDDKPGVGGSRHSKASQYRNQAVFARKWRAELARQRPPGTKLGYLGGRIDRRPRVLVADMWIPAYDRDSGSRRMTWLLTILRQLGCAVTYFTTDRQRVEPYVSLLQGRGVEVHYGPLSFAQFAEQRADGYDLVFLSRPNVALPLLDDVGRHFPLAPIVYDMSDAHFVREQRKEQVLGPGTASVDIERMREEEIECVRRSDVTTGPTQQDLDAMQELVPEGRFFVLPNAHELDAAPPLPFEERRDLVFIGGFNHDPNVDSARWLVADIMPLVRAELDVRLWLLGSQPSPEVLALAGRDVFVPGQLPEDEVSRRFREARVFVSPLRYGAGNKGKIGHAMAFGLPIVTTSIGAEGMDLPDGERALVRDSADEFARAVVDVYRNPELWERLSQASRSTVEERWTPEAMRRRLERLLAETLTLRVEGLASGGPR